MNATIGDPIRPTRREMVVVAAAAGGALLVGCSPASLLSIGAKEPDFGPFGPFIRIAADGSVTVVDKHIEFGQGTHAGLAALVCEELDADWDKVRVVEAPAIAKIYANLGQGVQGTGGSSAIANSWVQLRTAGAAARAMFVAAAASKWAVAPQDVRIKDGVVSHPSGRSAGFGELLADAGKIAPPQRPRLKDPAGFTLIGTDRVRRKDSAIKATGAARFTQDVNKPGMLTAMVVHPTRFGATVSRFDATEALRIPGVVEVFKIPSGVAVTAHGAWAARQARDLVKVVWNEDHAEMRGTDAIAARCRAIASGAINPQGEEEVAGSSRRAAARRRRRAKLSKRRSTSPSSPMRRWSR